MSGPTATAAWAIRVQGVVVQTSRLSPDSTGPARLGDREADVGGRVDDVLVAGRDLVRAQRRSAARAVGDDLVALVEAIALPVLLQRPPDRLDVVGLHGHVGVVEVDPVPDPLDHPVPVVDVGEHRLPAAAIELGDPEGLDLLLRADPELLLDLELDREAVAVPATLARHVEAAHRLVARVDVLEHPGEDVVGARPAVCGRRALVEAPDRLPASGLELTAEHLPLAPALEHALLQRREGLLGVDGGVAAHGSGRF